MGMMAQKLKITNLSSNGQELVEKFFLLTLFTAILGTVSSTFLFLHVIDNLGFSALGTIMATMFLVSALTDFPTGVLADWLGHKWVLSAAYVLFAISFLLLALADTFNQFIIAFIVLALANGQASGALQAWFDNSYKIACHDEDPKREIYREFMGHGMKYFQISSSVFFVIGGLIASSMSSGREIVFVFQALAMVAMAYAFAKTLDPIKDPEEMSKEDVGYFTLLFDGLKFAFSTRLMIFTVLSSVLLTTIGLVWYTLILFPIYFGYTGSDLGAGLLRWVIWFGGALFAGKAGAQARNKNEKTWLPLSNLISFMVFFGLTVVTLYIFEIKGEFNMFGVIAITGIFIVAGYFFTVNELLMQKFFLEVIPDDKRNSIYSLLPTLGMILGAPMVFLLGHSIEEIGFESAILIFIVIGLLGIGLQYISLIDYEPKLDIAEVILPYDVYSISNMDSFSYQIPKTWQVSSGIRKIWDQLVETAMIDGAISDDERAILDSVMKNLSDYGAAVEKAVEDGIITDIEQDELMKLKQKLIQDAEATMMLDGTVTPDEIDLLNKLASVINEIIIDRVTEDMVSKKES